MGKATAHFSGHSLVAWGTEHTHPDRDAHTHTETGAFTTCRPGGSVLVKAQSPTGVEELDLASPALQLLRLPTAWVGFFSRATHPETNQCKPARAFAVLKAGLCTEGA